jgi:hypothetical protein
MGFEITVDKTRAQLEGYRDGMIAAAAVKGRLATWLMRERPWDVFITAFGETHRGGTRSGRMRTRARTIPTPPRALEQVYRAVDDAVGAIVREAGEQADVVLFALHGMGPNSSQSHLTSTFMRRAVARFKGEPLPADAGDVPGSSARCGASCRDSCSSPSRMPSRARYATGSSPARSGGGYAWRETLGFCMHGDLAGYLRLNLAGREREGILTDERARRSRAFLRAELEAVDRRRRAVAGAPRIVPRAGLGRPARAPPPGRPRRVGTRPVARRCDPLADARDDPLEDGDGPRRQPLVQRVLRPPRSAQGRARGPRHIAEVGAYAAALT